MSPHPSSDVQKKSTHPHSAICLATAFLVWINGRSTCHSLSCRVGVIPVLRRVEYDSLLLWRKVGVRKLCWCQISPWFLSLQWQKEPWLAVLLSFKILLFPSYPYPDQEYNEHSYLFLSKYILVSSHFSMCFDHLYIPV